MSLSNHYKRFLRGNQAFLSRLRGKLFSYLKMDLKSPLRIRRRQFLWGSCLAFGITLFVYGVMSVLRDQGPVQKSEATLKPVTTNIATALAQVDLSEVQWYAFDEALKKLGKQVSDIKKKLEGSDEITLNLPGNPENPTLSHEGEAEDPKIALKAEGARSDDPRFQEIQERLSFLEAEREAQTQHPVNVPEVQDPGMGEDQKGRVIQKLSLDLTPSAQNLKTVETTIPAGAFAKTVLLSGLDASSAMNASTDPRPMLLRIIDHGTLPRRFQSDLKDCHCTAGAYGDLSSERVYARLEKLSCIDRFTGEIKEQQVSGYVSGSDGKAGIRGVVASRDGQFLARSLMGGIFAGLSNVANPQNRRAQVNPFFGGGALGKEIAGPSIEENFLSGMSSGATTALDRLSQYYIDRAEQLQPVIQIAAGQVVDIVFTGGAELRSDQSSVISNQNNNKGEIINDSI